eukprot:916532_1
MLRSVKALHHGSQRECARIITIKSALHTSITITNLSSLISKCKHKEHRAELERIHSWIDDNVSELNVYSLIDIHTALIAAYGRCQEVNKALKIFNNESCTRNKHIPFINAMLKTCIDNKRYDEALQMYYKYKRLTVKDRVSNFLALKACTHRNYFEQGKQIIAETNTTCTGTRFKALLIEFYGANAEITQAVNVFNSITDTEMDSFCIASMMKQYVVHGLHKPALDLYDRFESESITKHNHVAHLYAIKACSNMRDISKTIAIHSKIKGNPQIYDLKIKHTLILCYGKHKLIQQALRIFESIDEKARNNITYNSMIQAFMGCDLNQKALDLYDTLSTKDVFSHCLALKACVSSENKFTERGKAIHCELQPWLEDNKSNCKHTMELKSSLIDFYRYFDVTAAWNIFMSVADEYKSENGRLVAAMMKACIHNQDNRSALDLYDEFTALHNNRVIQMLGIKACCNVGDIEKGKAIHSACKIDTTKSNRQLDVDLKHTLIHLYGNAMEIARALDIFHSIDNASKSVITINAMMNAFCVCNLNKECIELFEDISNINTLIKPDIVSYKILVTAVTFVASLDSARNVYQDVTLNHEEMMNDMELCIKLINMNSKYGVVSNCIETFEWWQCKKKAGANIEMWNAMIRAYCSNNEFESGYEMYARLKEIRSIAMNEKTYIILLNACSHCGELDRAYHIWKNEIESPQLQFHVTVINTMVDCFARSGYLNNAHEFVIQFEKNTKRRNDVIWNTLMSGCCKYNDKLMAHYVYDEMTKRFKTKSNSMTGAKVSLSNLQSCIG